MPPPLITLRINDTGPAVTGLHNALGSLSIRVPDGERAENRLGEETSLAVAEFRRRFGLPQVSGSGPVVDASVGSLIHIAATFAESGDRAALKSAVGEAVSIADASQPEVNYWLARYAIIAGDYPTAAAAASKIERLSLPHLADVKDFLDHILEPLTPVPRPPELPYPENFYSYRENLISAQNLDELRAQIDGVTREQMAAAISTPSNPVDPNTIDLAALGRAQYIGRHALAAVAAWQAGNRYAARRQQELAIQSYAQCQTEAANYFLSLGYPVPSEGEARQRLQQVLTYLRQPDLAESPFWIELRWRRGLLSLQEIDEQDRKKLLETEGAFTSASKFLAAFTFFTSDLGTDPSITRRLQRLDPTLLVMATVWVPLARAEMNSQRRQFDAAITELISLRDSQARVESRFRYLCEFIEIPFIRLRLVETLFVKADAQYKARLPVAAGDVNALETARADYINRLPDPGGRNQAMPFQLLQAAKTYLSVVELFNNEGEYVSRVNQGLDTLKDRLDESLAQGDVRSSRFRAIGKDLTVPTIRPVDGKLPGLNRRVGPHEPLLKFEPPPGQPVMRETNPRVYSLLLEAQARLLQIWFGFNYLGYPDDYAPPWRFQFLLERARYFAEHAKNAQRDFLNFMSNAEREEFQEMSTAQNVELEKMNVLIEDARVDQVGLEVQAASESLELANLTARNAQDRLEAYQEFDEYADKLFDTAGLNIISGALGLIGEVPGLGTAVDVVGDLFGGGSVSRTKEKMLAAAQRELEKHNLQLAVQEANQSAVVASAQLEVARAGLLVAGLQKQAALLRHEFALQNLNFLRNRVLNAEQWYRLAATIRGVSETYLRYAVELSFLTEQAYEFEADKTINVIRFDYDQSEVGDFLAADFLLRDLNTLEQDLIINQRQRQQQVRYVLSMAREFPQALQELRDNGKATFSLPLEYLERRFLGLYNIRIGAVDVSPIALMDSTRFSMELIYLGSSSVRLKASPGADGAWTEQVRVRGPETTIFSGLTRQDASAIFPFATAGQRNAFEGFGAASAWQVDLSMKENQVVPGTLADLLFTFTLSGYYDSDLRKEIESVPRSTTLTKRLSARQNFPDAFYEFNRSGRMEWRVTENALTLAEPIGKLRNIAITLMPAPSRLQFGRLVCHRRIDFQVMEAGGVEVTNPVPRITFVLPGEAPENAGLMLKVKAENLDGALPSWDFGDGSERQSGAEGEWVEHTYAKPGRYEASLRLVHNNGRLFEHKADLIVSRNNGVLRPLAASASLRPDPNASGVAPGHTRVVASLDPLPGEEQTAMWGLRNDRATRKGGQASFDLKPGKYTLNFAAVRTLKARVYNDQLKTPDELLRIPALGLTTNRSFDADGNVISGTGPATPITGHLFPNNGVISPVDTWALELRLSDNPCLGGIGPDGTAQLDLGGVQDAILTLEYEVNSD